MKTVKLSGAGSVHCRTAPFGITQRGATPKAQNNAHQPRSASFLDIPCELRLRIYHSVYLSSPVQQPALAPWHPIPAVRKYHAQPVLHHGHAESHSDTPSIRLLDAERPSNRIPTALLQTSRQIYHEARTIPFHEGEQVFLNWFSSGLASALAFTRARQAWQRDAMRFVRLEVFAQDLVAAQSSSFADWIRLCEFWSVGLQGLRLRVFVEGGVAYRGWQDAARARALNGTEEEWRCARDLVKGKEQWITEGLTKMKGLRQMEIELVNAAWSPTDKLNWCARLQSVLVSASGAAMEIEVMCVEKVTSPGALPQIITKSAPRGSM